MNRLLALLLIGALGIAQAQAAPGADALAQADAAFAAGNYEQAVPIYRSLAEQGNAVAQDKLGLAYQFGFAVKKDYDQALHWYGLAAAQGNADGIKHQQNLKERIAANATQEQQIEQAATYENRPGRLSGGLLNFTGQVAQRLAEQQAGMPAGPSPGGTINRDGSNIAYHGPYEREVAVLLSHSPSHWTTPSCQTCNDGTPPAVPKHMNCVRDTYYYAALENAWGAEAHERVGNHPAAVENAKQMREALNNANHLCSNAPAVTPRICPSLQFYGCPGI